MAAFRTIIVREHQATRRSLAEWAKAAEVDRRALGRFTDSKRPISTGYAVRLCHGLGLGFDAVAGAAISLVFSAPASDRFQWKPRLYSHATLPDGGAAENTEHICRCFCTQIQTKMRASGITLTQAAHRSGLQRSTLSRWLMPERQNLMLPALFDLCLALECPLDDLAKQVAASFQTNLSYLPPSC